MGDIFTRKFIFDHSKDHISDALGLNEKRRDEIFTLLETMEKRIPIASERLQHLINMEGLQPTELIFAMYYAKMVWDFARAQKHTIPIIKKLKEDGVLPPDFPEVPGGGDSTNIR